MRTDLTFKTMERVLPSITEFFDDPEFDTLREDIKKKKITKASEIIPKMIMMFGMRHRDATIDIVAAIGGKTREEVEAQEFEKTLEDANGNLFDQMIGFFDWCLRFLLKM